MGNWRVEKFQNSMCLPMLIISTLQWSLTAYNVIMLGTALFSILPCIYLMFWSLSDKTIYYIALPSVFAYALLQFIQMIWAMKVGSQNLNIFLSVVYSILFTDIVLIRDIFIGSFLARMVSSRVQSTTDSIRIAVSRIGAIAAMSTAAHALPKMEIVGTMLIFVVFVFGVMVFVRRKSLMKPSIIIH